MAITPNLVREYRVKRLLTQEKLARRADLSVPTIQAVERGDNVRDITKEKLAQFFGVPREELFPGDPAAEPESAGVAS